MPNQKLLEITRVLSPEEHRRLRQFLQSPYFNQGYNAERLVALYELIRRCRSNEAHPLLGKKALSQQFFPHKTYKEKAKNPIDSLASELLQLVRRFIALEGQERAHSAVEEQLAVARFYRKHNFEERFWQQIQHCRKALQRLSEHEGAFSLYNFYLEEEVATFRSTYNTYSDDANLRAALGHLNAFYNLYYLEFTCALEFQSQLSNQPLRPDPQWSVPQPGNHSGPLAVLYQQVLHLLRCPDDEAAFASFETDLESQQSCMNPDSMRNLQAYYRYLAGSRFLLRHSTNNLRQLFDLYRQHLEAGYLFVDGKILPATLKSLVNLALKLGEIIWAEHFLASITAQKITGTRFPLEALCLCRAEVLFYKKDYTAANELLVYRHFENVHYNILVDVLQIKIYYETNDELIESRLQALVQKVRRAAFAKEFRVLYLNFIRALEKILRCRWTWTPAKRAELQQEISQKGAVLEREWLLGLLH